MPSTIHTYRSGESALFVNSYLVEGEGGVVSIDAPMLVSDARAYRARLEALRKPLAGVLLTHPHPDHYNGLTELVAGLEVPILALPEVDREIRERDAAKREQWGPLFGDEWPEESTFPSETAEPGSEVELAGLRFTPIDAGAGESVSETIWRLEGDGAIAFVGDLVYNGTHSYIADGLTAAWIESLDRSVELLDPAATLYIGHGAPVGVEALQRQKSYLMMLREVVGRLAGGDETLDDAAAEELVRVMGEYTGGAPLDWLLTRGRDAVAAELARDGGMRRR
jgi:glyoxylase-like metal-dependent hydrolase (beta-lactamase superfamily II)